MRLTWEIAWIDPPMPRKTLSRYISRTVPRSSSTCLVWITSKPSIAVGRWQQKNKIVPKWLARAKASRKGPAFEVRAAATAAVEPFTTEELAEQVAQVDGVRAVGRIAPRDVEALAAVRVDERDRAAPGVRGHCR